MSEKNELLSKNREEILIRNALQQMDVPTNHHRLKQRFLQIAGEKFAVREHRWQSWKTRFISPQLAMMVTACYGIFLCGYLFMVMANSPISQVSYAESATATLQSWIVSFRSSKGLKIPFEAQSKLELQDGSVLHCLSPSTLSIVFTPEQRRIQLQEGTIAISVARNAKTHFIVAVNNTEIIATGTRFMVSTDPFFFSQEVSP